MTDYGWLTFFRIVQVVGIAILMIALILRKGRL
jgi:hypothetical protein